MKHKDPKLHIVYMALNALSEDPSNPRKHPTQQLKQLMRAMEICGFITPIVIDAHNRIVAGQARFQAASKLGFKTIPAIQVSHLNDAELRAYRLADNKLCENAEWDQKLLKVEFEYLTSLEFEDAVDLDMTGFSTTEIDLIIGDLSAAEGEGDIPALPDEKAVVTQSGDLWLLGKHRILCGNCLSANSYVLLMDGEQASMVITDPPYNVPISGHVSGLGKHQHGEFAMASGEMSREQFESFLYTALGAAAKVSRSGALHYVFMDWRHMLELLTIARTLYDRHINTVVWNKTNGGMGSLYRSQHEMVGVFKVGTQPHRNNVELGKYGRYRTNVWEVPGMNAFGSERDDALAMHPTVKPVQLLAEAILDVTARNDIVLDPFLGSGSTLLAADKTGRIGYGMEIEPRYVDVAIRRWQSQTGGTAILAHSGQSFDELLDALETTGPSDSTDVQEACDE